jgi:subtilisin
MTDHILSRRRLLKCTVTGALGTVALSGQTAAARPERVNVGIRTPAAERAAKGAAMDVRREFDWEDGTKTISMRIPRRAREHLEQHPAIRYVEPDATMQAVSETVPWSIDRIDADVVHANGETGGDNSDGEGGADIAILDTGIDPDHPDLLANVGAGTAFVSCSDCSTDWGDDNGHGTLVAGIADAQQNGKGVRGVSTGATLHAVKVLNQDGQGYYSDIAAGLEWAADRGYDVANMSFGGPESDTLKDAVDYAWRKGMLLVAAAGNSGCADCVLAPAMEPEVIAVSATDQNDDLSDFSNTGPEIELAAPGTSVPTTAPGGDYQYMSGTSAATPHVAGGGAQLLDNGYSNEDARTRLADTAEDVGLSSDQQGNGLIDVAAAVLDGSSDDGSTNAAPTVDFFSISEVEDDGTAGADFDVSWSVSDSDGNLDTVEVTLADDSDGETEDSATITISGDSASGTTRLFAADEDGSGNSYTADLVVTDESGATASDAASTTESEPENDAPTVDSVSASEVEDDGTSGVDVDVSWSVSDANGNLDTVDVVLSDDADGETEASRSVAVGGDSASGTTRLVAADEDGAGHTYTATVTATDERGASASGSGTVTESEPTTSNPPTIESWSIESSSPFSQHADITVDWSVADSDGDLATVTVEVIDQYGGDSGETLTDSTAVSGASASGTTRIRDRNEFGFYDVTVLVTDAAGNTTESETRSVTA